MSRRDSYGQTGQFGSVFFARRRARGRWAIVARLPSGAESQVSSDARAAPRSFEWACRTADHLDAALWLDLLHWIGGWYCWHHVRPRGRTLPRFSDRRTG